MTSALFSPIKLADLQLANRIAVSPMCQYSANDGVADDWNSALLNCFWQSRRRVAAKSIGASRKPYRGD
jgi:hypothetical protein